MTITEQHRDFFRTFGYLSLPGLLRVEIGWITEAFMEATREALARHDPSRRTDVTACLERSEALCRIIDLPQIDDVMSRLLGSDWCYYSSDGNYYSGDTGWHSDSDWVHGICIKVPLYFDELDAGTGALRVIPGTHLRGGRGLDARQAGDAQKAWGIEGSEVPCVVFPNRPGDLVAIDTNIMHAAFGGGTRRRMLALQFWTAFRSEDQYAELDRHMNNWSGAKIPIHSELLHRSAPPARRPHIMQVAARHAVHPRYERPPWLDAVLDARALADQPPARERRPAT